MYVKKLIAKMDKTFFENPSVKENLQFLKIGESGSSRGPISRIKYLWNVLRLKSKRDVKTLYAFPAKEVTPAEVTLVYPRQSNKTSEYKTIRFTNPRSNDEFLTPEEQAGKATNDKNFHEAAAKEEYPKARKIGKERGDILREPLEAVFEGTPERDTTKKRLKLGGFRGIRILLRALGSKPMRELRKLYAKGYKVYSFVSEFDRIVTDRRSAKFYRDKLKAKQNMRIIEGSPHDGVALQADVWANATKDMFETNTNVATQDMFDKAA